MNKRPKSKIHPWVKENDILNNKLNKIGNIKEIREFFWNRNIKKNSTKVKLYDNSIFE